MSDNEYGTVTIGASTKEPKEVKIESFVQSEFKDNRLVSVMELEDGTYAISVENPTSTGRNPVNTIRLPRESFVALIMGCHLFWNCKRVSIMKEIAEACENQNFDYTVSDNLQLFDPNFNIRH